MNINIIATFINEAEHIKRRYSEYWNQEFETLLLELRHLDELYAMDSNEATRQFNLMPLSKYQTFGHYIKSKDINITKIKVRSSIKNKRHNNRCPNCFSTLTECVEGTIICAKCKCTIKQQTSTLATREGVDISKHIMKQLNIVTGKNVSPPTYMSKVLPCLDKWFNNKQYISHWLKFSDRLEVFNERLGQLTSTPLIELGEIKNYGIFKMFTDEFYALTEYVKNCQPFHDLFCDSLIVLCESYYNQFNDIPELNTTYEFNNTSYPIGKLLSKYRTSDIYNVTPTKQQLNKIFKQDITLPGLIFEYKYILNTNGQIPKKYNYQQNYIYILKYVYHIKLQEMLESDKHDIVAIMSDFNEFVKKQKYEETGKQHNSCLWQIVLLFILQYPYYHCYHSVIDVLPIRSVTTTVKIRKYWEMYNILNYDMLEKYRKVFRTECQTIKNTTTKVYQSSVNYDDIMSFINQTGEYYKASDEDKYVKDKMCLNDNFDATYDRYGNTNLIDSTKLDSINQTEQDSINLDRTIDNDDSSNSELDIESEDSDNEVEDNDDLILLD